MQPAFFKNTLASLPVFYRIIAIGIFVLLISFLFPVNKGFQYNYKQGERWTYQDLKAPFDFPVLKTAQDIALQQQQILANHIPYYRWDKKGEEQALYRFQQRFEQALLQDSSGVDSLHYNSFGKQLTGYFYKQKLIEIRALDTIGQKPLVVHLLDGHIDMGEKRADVFWTQAMLMQQLIDTLHSVADDYPDYRFMFEVMSDVLNTKNVVFDSLYTQKIQNESLESISPFLGRVSAGDMVVAKTQLVDSITYSRLRSFEVKYNQEIGRHQDNTLLYLSYLILTLGLVSILMLFMQFYAHDVLHSNRQFTMVLSTIVLYAYFAHFIHQGADVDLYLVPFCIIPILIFNFFSAELAFITHLIVILLVSMLLGLDYQFILVQFLVGMMVIVTKLKTRYLSDFFLSLTYLAAAYVISFVCLELLNTGALFDVYADNGLLITKGVRWNTLGWILLNVFLTLLSYPLIPIFERLLGVTSDITLMELSDLNNPLLKKLSMKAPGTFQHSLQVSNLAEAATYEIGGNTLLVKVAALFHDIGKMENPSYFIENQHGENPHDNCDCKKSAQIIINHVSDGVELAKKYRLPTVLIDFIRTHHGTTQTKYFYLKYKEAHPDEMINEADFSYPGPKPFTREQAVLMLADSVEAASKSLRKPTGQDIDQLVDQIVKGKIKQGQLVETPLSFKELEKVKQVFKQLLRSIYHVRVEYPVEGDD